MSRGPDEDTPHGLLPPLQRETLTFTRGQEMGLQWLVDVAAARSRRVDQLAAAEHRRRIASGSMPAIARASALRAAVCAPRPVARRPRRRSAVRQRRGPRQPGGGARRSSGRRGAAARRLVARRAMRWPRATCRIASGRTTTQNGLGVFARAARRARRLAHATSIVWRSRDTLKEEGDAELPDAAARRHACSARCAITAKLGSRATSTRAPACTFAAALRVHRIESHYEYPTVSRRVRSRSGSA